MRPISTVIPHHHRRGRLLSLVGMSIAIGLVAIIQSPNRAGGEVVKQSTTVTSLAAACYSLTSLINQSLAQSDKGITQQQTSQLINGATQIRTEPLVSDLPLNRQYALRAEIEPLLTRAVQAIFDLVRAVEAITYY